MSALFSIQCPTDLSFMAKCMAEVTATTEETLCRVSGQAEVEFYQGPVLHKDGLGHHEDKTFDASAAIQLTSMRMDFVGHGRRPDGYAAGDLPRRRPPDMTCVIGKSGNERNLCTGPLFDLGNFPTADRIPRREACSEGWVAALSHAQIDSPTSCHVFPMLSPWC
ncbi:hypothetical protein LX36DRAFT_278255 [Colletotrichum falcatum]|nr:hypothetical protein LX36DRAFT_278255 [Colletotrichum falcatum]